MGNGGADLVERAAPQPAVGVEVGIALRTLAAGTVAGRAIIAECRPAVSAGEFRQFGIGVDLLKRGLVQLVHDAGALNCEIGEILLHGAARRPAQYALGVAAGQRDGRIKNPVTDGPDDEA